MVAFTQLTEHASLVPTLQKTQHFIFVINVFENIHLITIRRPSPERKFNFLIELIYYTICFD